VQLLGGSREGFVVNHFAFVGAGRAGPEMNSIVLPRPIQQPQLRATSKPVSLTKPLMKASKGIG